MRKKFFDRGRLAGRVFGAAIGLGMAVMLIPATASAGVTDVTGGSTSSRYQHTYHTNIKGIADITVNYLKEDGTLDRQEQLTVEHESGFIKGNLSDDAVLAEIAAYYAKVDKAIEGAEIVSSERQTQLVFDHFESSNIIDFSGSSSSSVSKKLDVHEYQIYEIHDIMTVQYQTKAADNGSKTDDADKTDDTDKTEAAPAQEDEKPASAELSFTFGQNDAVCFIDHQGEKCQAAFKAARPAGYEEAFSLSMLANKGEGYKTSYDLKSGKFVLDIPEAWQKDGRVFALIGIDEQGRTYLFADEDTDDGTITVSLNLQGYAFSLIYTDAAAAKN